MFCIPLSSINYPYNRKYYTINLFFPIKMAGAECTDGNFSKPAVDMYIT